MEEDHGPAIQQSQNEKCIDIEKLVQWLQKLH